jgi:hypothetical protein
MKAKVLYEHKVLIEKEGGGGVELIMKDQTVEVIEPPIGGNLYKCKTIGFPWVGTFYLSKNNFKIIE